MTRCPSCGSDNPEKRTYCPSTPDRCPGCETCEDKWHGRRYVCRAYGCHYVTPHIQGATAHVRETGHALRIVP